VWYKFSQPHPTISVHQSLYPSHFYNSNNKMDSSVCNQMIIRQIKVFTAQSCLKNKTTFLLDLKVQIAVKKKMAGMSFCTKMEERDIRRKNQIMLSTYSSSSTYSWYLGSFLAVKLLGSGLDHPPPASARLRLGRAVPVLPICAFVTCCRVICTY